MNINDADAEVVNRTPVESYDRVKEARDREAATQYNTKAEIRIAVSRASQWLIYAMAGGAIVILCVYLGCLGLEPFYPEAKEIKENYEVLFFDMFKLLPWLLLFLFGDAKKIGSLLNKEV